MSCLQTTWILYDVKVREWKSFAKYKEDVASSGLSVSCHCQGKGKFYDVSTSCWPNSQLIGAW